MKLKFGDGWKKVNSDKDHTTLQHDDGHQMKIRHSSLAPKLRGQLASLPMLKAEGGEIEDEDDEADMASRRADQDLVDSASSPDLQRMVMMESQEKRMAKGGQVRHYAEGTPDGPVAPNQAPASTPININIGAPPQMPANLINPDAGAMAAMGRPQQMSAAQQGASDPGSLPMGVTPEMVAHMQAPQQNAPQANPMAAISNQGAPQAQPPADKGPAQPAATDNMGMGAMQEAFNVGTGLRVQGTEQEATALGAQGDAQAKELEHSARVMDNLSKSWQKQYDAHTKEYQDLQQEVRQGMVDPNHFWNSKDAGAKTSAAIGLILGGIGSGMAGGPNQALEFLNKQIDRDIHAQQANLGNKNNLLAANLKQFGNMKDATDMLRLQHMAAIQARLQIAGAKAQSPLAQARASQAEGQIYQAAAPMIRDMATRQAMVGAVQGANKDPSSIPHLIEAARWANPEYAKSLEERFVPGVGLAPAPVPADVKKSLVAQQSLLKLTQTLQDFTKKHGTSFSSFSPEVKAQGETLIRELQGLYRQATDASTSEGEQKIIDQITGADPSGFLAAWKDQPKLKALHESMGARYNNTLKGWGLSPNEAQSAETKIIGGRTYMKGPDGKAILVK